MGDERLVPTPIGDARISWFAPEGTARAVTVLGHGSATGVESADLQAVAAALPHLGVTVALVTQPYRLSARRHGSDKDSLDLAWRSLWPAIAELRLPVIAGGRSAGSQVACRTAKDLGAVGVLALSYPLLGPGSPKELLATDLPMLIVQGGHDPYGRPDQFPPLPTSSRLVEIPCANHTFGVPGSLNHSGAQTMSLITQAVTSWVEQLLTGADRRP
jgi:predicted alpha/beta-hydrolase family hydrolase